MKPAYLIPKSPIKPTSDKRAHSLQLDTLDHAEIIETLKVKTSPRYKPTGGTTYCNIAAHDFATLYGVYIPRVWWTEEALKRGDKKESYGINVKEQSANMLATWFKKYGPEFGWRPATAIEAQNKVNNGGFAIIVAARKDRSRSGHITVIVPGELKSGIPNQWQAGAINHNSIYSKWYLSPLYENVGIYINER